MLHNLFPNIVHLDEETHKYYDVYGKEYMSWTRVLNEFLSKKFDSDRIASYIAASQNTTPDVIQSKWLSQRDEGVRIDNALTLYSRTGQILESDKDLESLIKTVLFKYKDYKICHEQLIIYNQLFRTAGTMDKLALTGNRKDSGFKIFDFKCFEGGMSYEYKGQKWLNYPFDCLVNSKYNKIAIQLSFYAWHLENLTGRKCEGLFIDLIIPFKNPDDQVTYTNELIPVVYNKCQIELLLNTNKDKILSLLEPIVITQEDESF